MTSRAVPKPAPRRSRNLAHELVDAIGDRIRDGRLAAGDKLPTEAEIMAAFGVSRTVVREALSNVLNHAKAQEAEVRVTCNSDGSVSATVTDDGIGIHQVAGAHHYGMTIMEERAKNLGGHLSVENLPTLGTRVTLHFMPSTRREGSIPIHPVQLS